MSRSVATPWSRLVGVAGGRRQLRTIALLAAALALAAGDQTIVGAVAPDLKHALGIGNTEIGLLITAASLVGCGDDPAVRHPGRPHRVGSGCWRSACSAGRSRSRAAGFSPNYADPAAGAGRAGRRDRRRHPDRRVADRGSVPRHRPGTGLRTDPGRRVHRGGHRAAAGRRDGGLVVLAGRVLGAGGAGPDSGVTAAPNAARAGAGCTSRSAVGQEPAPSGRAPNLTSSSGPSGVRPDPRTALTDRPDRSSRCGGR